VARRDANEETPTKCAREPVGGGTIPAHDPFLVSLDVRQIISLKTHAALCEFINRLIHITNREIKDGERRRSMIRLRINENIIAAGEMQRSKPFDSETLSASVRP
jgi:hypothetical protein